MDSDTGGYGNTEQRQPSVLPRRVRIERGIYCSPASGRLEIQFTDREGRTRWQAVPGDLENARQARAAAQLGLGSPRGRGRAGGVSFTNVADEWLERQTHLRPRTRALYETALRRHLCPRIGRRRIDSVDEAAIAQVVAELQAAGLAGWTIRGILVPLGRVLNYAVRQKWIPDNPIRRLERSERPRVIRRELRILLPEEIAALLRATPGPYRPVLATAVFTGLRQGELLGLCWSDIDFDRELVRVRRQLDRSGTYSEPKTPRAIRTVLLMPSLAGVLHQHRHGTRHQDPNDPVFATATGRPMYYRNLTRRGLARAITDAGLDRPGEPHLRFHDLRHTFASLLIAQGLNVVFISRQLGHASPGFTLDVYGGLFDAAEHQRRASDALEAAFAETLVGTRGEAGPHSGDEFGAATSGAGNA